MQLAPTQGHGARREAGDRHMGPDNSLYSACQDLFLGSGYSSPEKEMPFSNPSPRGASFSIVTKLARDMIVVGLITMETSLVYQPLL